MQEHYQESGPGKNAEQMFADDPEMLEMIRQARKEQGTVSRKPIWWQVFMVALGLIVSAVTTLPALLEVVPFHFVLPAAGLFGGMSLALGILGHRPGQYEIDQGLGNEKKRATLWKPLPVLPRLGAFALGLGAPAAAIALQLLS
jgi:hypothetical protein